MRDVARHLQLEHPKEWHIWNGEALSYQGEVIKLQTKLKEIAETFVENPYILVDSIR